jgi:hypothetical protein
MIRMALCRVGRASLSGGRTASQFNSANTTAIPPIPIQDAIPVNVRIRPRDAGVFYTQGLQITGAAQDCLRPGLIMDCYA